MWRSSTKCLICKKGKLSATNSKIVLVYDKQIRDGDIVREACLSSGRLMFRALMYQLEARG